MFRSQRPSDAKSFKPTVEIIQQPGQYFEGPPPDPNKVLSIDSLFSQNEQWVDPMQVQMPNFEAARCSTKKNGIIKAYGANTNQGIFRDYNEDRVSIILNIMKPQGKDDNTEWPSCSFFAVYDGHGGASCADFLRDNLH